MGLCQCQYWCQNKQEGEETKHAPIYDPLVGRWPGREDFLFVEVKTTASKTVKELPFGAFFGFTENEESLFRSQSYYRLCIVHTVMKQHYMMRFEEYESLIQNKGIQYQISFRSSR